MDSISQPLNPAQKEALIDKIFQDRERLSSENYWGALKKRFSSLTICINVCQAFAKWEREQFRADSDAKREFYAAAWQAVSCGESQEPLYYLLNKLYFFIKQNTPVNPPLNSYEHEIGEGQRLPGVLPPDDEAFLVMEAIVSGQREATEADCKLVGGAELVHEEVNLAPEERIKLYNAIVNCFALMHPGFRDRIRENAFLLPTYLSIGHVVQVIGPTSIGLLVKLALFARENGSMNWVIPEVLRHIRGFMDRSTLTPSQEEDVRIAIRLMDFLIGGNEEAAFVSILRGQATRLFDLLSASLIDVSSAGPIQNTATPPACSVLLYQTIQALWRRQSLEFRYYCGVVLLRLPDPRPNPLQVEILEILHRTGPQTLEQEDSLFANIGRCIEKLSSLAETKPEEVLRLLKLHSAVTRRVLGHLVTDSARVVSTSRNRNRVYLNDPRNRNLMLPYFDLLRQLNAKFKDSPGESKAVKELAWMPDPEVSRFSSGTFVSELLLYSCGDNRWKPGVLRDTRILFNLLDNNWLPPEAYERFATFADFKEFLFEYIQTLPREEQLEYLIKALTEDDSTFGRFFWIPRGATWPDLAHGLLRKIHMHYFNLLHQRSLESQPSEKVPHQVSASSAPGRTQAQIDDGISARHPFFYRGHRLDGKPIDRRQPDTGNDDYPGPL